MGILRLERTKETFKEKIKSQSQGSQEGILLVVDNFERFSMEKYGKVNIVPDLKDSTEEEIFELDVSPVLNTDEVTVQSLN